MSSSIGLIALFAALAVFFTCYAIYAPIQERKSKKIELDPEVTGEASNAYTEYEGDDSLGKYVRPILNNFLPQLPKFKLSEERKSNMDKLLIHSGNPWKVTPEEFIGLQLALSIFGVLLGAAIGALNVLPAAVPPIVLVIFMGGAGYALPYSVYNTRRQARTKAIEKELPESLDLLTITIASGQAFEFALQSVTSQLSEGLLKTEFAKVVVELQAGSNLERSFTNLSKRFDSDDLESFTKAVIQSTELGSDVSETLAQQAEYVRSNYEARLERMIARLETTMFIPLIMTMLPAFMIIFIAPTLTQLGSYL
jgi:tight adherence protein C